MQSANEEKKLIVITVVKLTIHRKRLGRRDISKVSNGTYILEGTKTHFFEPRASSIGRNSCLVLTPSQLPVASEVMVPREHTTTALVKKYTIQLHSKYVSFTSTKKCSSHLLIKVASLFRR